MATLGEVKERTRSLVEDENADFTTDAYITPKINQAYGCTIGALLDVSCNPFETAVREALAIKAGATDLIAQTVVGGTWEGLDNPLILEVKLAGSAPESYRRVPIVPVLPNVSPITANVVTGMWGSNAGAAEWRGNQLYITPFQFDFDAQLRGEFRPPKLVKDEDLILVHWEMTELLSFQTAAIIGMARGDSSWVSQYGPEADRVFDSIASKLTKELQGQTIKFGKPRKRRRLW